ncbi:MAG: asparagine synthetase B [Chloroflexi bacterium]|nr:asparagine synthetase B [Chloroflexota bacterium]
MSGLFGLINFNAEPIALQKLEVMQAATPCCKPDDARIVIDKNVGFGQLLKYNTPESVYESLPCKTVQDQLFTAVVRLDNRNALCRQFGISNAEQPTTPDSRLIWLAYQKWGDDCPDHLLGDWVFAIWNPQEQRLFLARDHHGNSSLYYYRADNQFMFASSRKALLALGVPRRLDELYLAQVLITWTDYHGKRTMDLDIFRLPPAHAMTVTPDSVRTWKYWQLEETPLLHLPSFDEYIEGFLEIFAEAVRCRLRSYRPIGVTLSGGLDSGSVTALAARELQKRGKSLTAFTSVPLYDTSQSVSSNRFGDETEYAQCTANSYDNIDHNLISAEQISPVAGLKQMLTILNEPGHAGGNYFWIVSLFKAAQQLGIGTLLTGQGGNATVSWIGAPELSSMTQLIQQQGWKAGLKSMMPAPLLRAYQLRRLNQISWDGSAIHPAFASRLALARQHIEAASNGRDAPYRWRSPIDKRLSIIKPGDSLVGFIWAEMGAAFGMEVRDPTFDKRVMTYTLSIPDHHFVGQNGLDRRIIRAAMVGILPDPVRLNQKRGRQAADLGYRLRDSADEVNAALNSLAQTQAAAYLDIEKMQGAFTNVVNDVNKHHTGRASTVLMRGLDAGLFLKDQKIVDCGGITAVL